MKIPMSIFSFSVFGEAMRWVYELPRDSITSWEELQDIFLKRFFHPRRWLSCEEVLRTSKQLMVSHCMRHNYISKTFSSMPEPQSFGTPAITVLLCELRFSQQGVVDQLV